MTDNVAEQISRELAVRKAEVPSSRIERLAIVRTALSGQADDALDAQALACVRANPGEIDLQAGSFVKPLLALLDLSGSEVSKALLSQEYEAHRDEQGYQEASPLERLLIERVAVCRMQLAFYEKEYALGHGAGAPIAIAVQEQKRIDSAHRRYLHAIKSLSQVRKLQIPSVQVNIGEKQVNVSHSSSPPF